jgi:hypothetical protein
MHQTKNVGAPTFWSAAARHCFRDRTTGTMTEARHSGLEPESKNKLSHLKVRRRPTVVASSKMSARRHFSSFFQKNRPRHCAIPPPVVSKLAPQSRAIAQERTALNFNVGAPT